MESAELPQGQVGDATVKTLVGEGSPTTLHTPAVYYDVTVPAGGQTELPLPDGYQGFAYVLEGRGSWARTRQAVTAGQLAVLGQEGCCRPPAGAEGLRFVLAAGTPYHEAPRWNGPYVD